MYKYMGSPLTTADVPHPIYTSKYQSYSADSILCMYKYMSPSNTTDIYIYIYIYIYTYTDMPVGYTSPPPRSLHPHLHPWPRGGVWDEQCFMAGVPRSDLLLVWCKEGWCPQQRARCRRSVHKQWDSCRCVDLHIYVYICIYMYIHVYIHVYM